MEHPDEPPARVAPVTIRDVAKLAGVSVTTVSHSLTGKRAVRAETQQRVRDAVRDLGYRPNSMARGLRTSRMRVISLVMRPLEWLGEYQPSGVDYFMRLVGAAAVRALDEGYTLLLVRDPTLGSTPDIAYSVDGCIIADPEASDPVIAAMQAHGIPVVAIGRDVDRLGFSDWVGDQGTEQVHTMLNLLHSGGARSVAVLAGTQTNAWNYDSQHAVEEWSIAHADSTVVVYPVSEAEGVLGGRRIGAGLLASGEALPDAFYAFTGRHAAGLAEALTDAGVDIPGQVQIACGNDSEQCRSATPAITAVNLNPEALGREAVGMLLDRIDGRPSVARDIESEYHYRGSTRHARL